MTYDTGEPLTDETVRRVHDVAPDVIIGGGNWRSWVPPEFYEAAEYGYIWIHGSLLPLARAGVTFIDGEQLERENQEDTERAAA